MPKEDVTIVNLTKTATVDLYEMPKMKIILRNMSKSNKFGKIYHI